MYNRQNCRALHNKSLHGVSVPKCWTKKKKKGSTPCIIRLKIQNPNWSCKMGSNMHREKQRRQQIMFSVGKWRLVCDLINCKFSGTLEQWDQVERNCQVKAMLERECSHLRVRMVELVMYCISCLFLQQQLMKVKAQHFQSWEIRVRDESEKYQEIWAGGAGLHGGQSEVSGISSVVEGNKGKPGRIHLNFKILMFFFLSLRLEVYTTRVVL